MVSHPSPLVVLTACCRDYKAMCKDYYTLQWVTAAAASHLLRPHDLLASPSWANAWAPWQLGAHPPHSIRGVFCL